MHLYILLKALLPQMKCVIKIYILYLYKIYIYIYKYTHIHCIHIYMYVYILLKDLPPQMKYAIQKYSYWNVGVFEPQ